MTKTTTAKKANPTKCTKYLPPDNPRRIERDLAIANERIKGRTYTQISKKFNLSKQQINTILKREELQEALKAAQVSFMSMAPAIADKHLDYIFMDEVNGEKVDHKTRTNMILAAEKNVGISPTHTNITNIFADNRRQMITIPLQANISTDYARMIEADLADNSGNNTDNGGNNQHNQPDNYYDAEIVGDNDG